MLCLAAKLLFSKILSTCESLSGMRMAVAKHYFIPVGIVADTTKHCPYHFSYSRYYTEGSQQYRDEIKAYGILFMVEVTGQVRLCTT